MPDSSRPYDQALEENFPTGYQKEVDPALRLTTQEVGGRLEQVLELIRGSLTADGLDYTAAISLQQLCEITLVKIHYCPH